MNPMNHLLKLGLLALSLLGAACAESGTRAECRKDGDCKQNWRCDVYSGTCRCVSDAGCNALLNERCMPSGLCQVYTGCSSNEECDPCQVCSLQTGECLCNDDCGCPEGNVCNSSGYCQPNSGCFDNTDCADTQICDTGSKTCIPDTSCTSKLQCPIGNLCTNGTCVAGCEDFGDCPFKWACKSGQCVEGVCDDSSFCDFLESCQAGNCNTVVTTDDPYCGPCDSQTLYSCGAKGNRCLIYPYTTDPYYSAFSTSHADWKNKDGSANYCGIDCSGDVNMCPFGFECSSIITVTTVCTKDADCSGVPCVKSEEEDQGFCPCKLSGACPANTCNKLITCGPITKKCMGALTGMNVACATDADCYYCTGTYKSCSSAADCPSIQCETFPGQDYGGCVVGKSCGMLEGFHCPVP